MKTLILDNYDSFTYNLYQYIGECGGDPIVYRNNKVSIADIKKMKITHIVISPGAGHPDNEKDFGICGKVIKHFKDKLPILGVCLGHQGIVSNFGGKIIKAREVVHGKKCIIINNGSTLFDGIEKNIEVMRYHSLVVDRESLPSCFVISSFTKENGIIMSIQHKKYPLFGIQFHPESIGTIDGKRIIKNFLKSNLS